MTVSVCVNTNSENQEFKFHCILKADLLYPCIPFGEDKYYFYESDIVMCLTYTIFTMFEDTDKLQTIFCNGNVSTKNDTRFCQA